MTTLYETFDSTTGDAIEISRDGDRLLLRSLIDGRERTVLLLHGRAEAARLARALAEFGAPEASERLREVRPWA